MAGLLSTPDKDAVWMKGHVIVGYDPRDMRKDDLGYFIRYSEYGEHSTYGWEIDHIIPKSRGGSDFISNLRPLWWQANAARGGRLSH